MSIGNRIKQRREELGYTQPQLATLIGVSKGTIGNYESNISSPNEDILFKLFDVLECDANFLYQDHIDMSKLDTIFPSEIAQIKKYRTLDEYGKQAVDSVLNIEYDRCTYIEERPTIELPIQSIAASAGTGQWLDDEYTERIRVADTLEARKANIVIKVNGDSMFPSYKDGDKVLVRLQRDISIGEIGIFVVNGSAYIKEKGNNELVSLNPEFDNIAINEYDRIDCVGKVIGIAEVVN